MLWRPRAPRPGRHRADRSRFRKLWGIRSGLSTAFQRGSCDLAAGARDRCPRPTSADPPNGLLCTSSRIDCRDTPRIRNSWHGDGQQSKPTQSTAFRKEARLVEAELHTARSRAQLPRHTARSRVAHQGPPGLPRRRAAPTPGNLPATAMGAPSPVARFQEADAATRDAAVRFQEADGFTLDLLLGTFTFY